jgi:hypothetical protein
MAEQEPRRYGVPNKTTIAAPADGREREYAERHQRMLECEQRLQESPVGQRFLERIRRAGL